MRRRSGSGLLRCFFAATTLAFAASTCASFSASAESEDGVSARASVCGAASVGASVGAPDSGGVPSCAIQLSYTLSQLRFGLYGHGRAMKTLRSRVMQFSKAGRK